MSEATAQRQTVRLVSVYTTPNAYAVLYELLKERTKQQSISFVSLPTMAEHINFVVKKPYEAWYLIEGGPRLHPYHVGAIYLTKLREVGVFIFRCHNGKGFGTAAFAALREQHPGRILANVNPMNEPSLDFFRKHGGKVIQHTFLLA